MPGYFESSFVGFFDSGPQLVAGNVHIGFERGRAFIGPEVHHSPRVVRSGKLVHHRRISSLTLEVRSGDMDLWTDHTTAVDEAFNLKIGKRGNAAGGADGRNAKGEIKTRKADTHVRIDRRRSALWKEHMIVHPDKSRQHGVSGHIKRLRASRNAHRR